MSNEKKGAASKKAAKTTKKKVATVKKEELAVSGSFLDGMASDSGAGQENMGVDDYAIPRLYILHHSSPQCLEGDDALIDGAKSGMFFNTVTNEIHSGATGITVIPISFRAAYIEWKPRKAGGGIVRDHGDNRDILATCKKGEKGEDITPDGNNVVRTAEYIVLFKVKDTDEYSPAVIAMSSTQLKKSKKWNTAIESLRMTNSKGEKFKPSMFAKTYHATTVPESNPSGTWFGWSIQPGPDLGHVKGGEAIYDAAKKFHETVRGGDVKISPQVQATVTESDDTPM